MGKTKQKQDRSHYLFSNQELANLIGPLVIEQLLAVFVGMADSIMVANVGEAAVSGVSLVDNIMILYQRYNIEKPKSSIPGFIS